MNCGCNSNYTKPIFHKHLMVNHNLSHWVKIYGANVNLKNQGEKIICSHALHWSNG